MSTPEGVDLLEHQLILLFRRARTGFEELARDVHPALDAAAYGILYLVRTGDATTVTALAEWLSVGKPTVSRQVRALEELGLLCREPDEADGRAARLRLSPDGQARFDAARGRRRQRFRAQLGGWDERDVATLADLLTRFNRLY